MSVCVSVVAGYGAVFAVSPQPTDMSTCTALLLTPSEVSALKTSSSSSPDPATVAEFFSFGFALVVGAYLSGLAVGYIRRTVRRAG